MNFFVKEIFEKGVSEAGHQHFVRYGKGNYKRRFLMNLRKGPKVKIRGSFELANDFVTFVNENKEVKFSGKILMKDKVDGKKGKKKGGGFVYDVSESSLKEFENAYFYLLDADADDIVLKIKKKIPKPGKSANKIDDKFCSMDLDLKYLDKVRDVFFWDVPNGKKVSIEHEIVINEIVLPKGEDDPKKIRELAKRKGKIIRTINVDGEEITKETNFEC